MSFLIRLATLGFLGMIGYFTLKNVFADPDEPIEPPPRKKTPESDDFETARRQAGQDMVVDPVCETYIEQKDAPYLIHNGRKIHFCSEKCKQEFIRKTGGQHRPD